MAQLLRALVTFVEDPSPIPSACMEPHTISWNAMLSSGFARHQEGMCAESHGATH